MKADKGQCQGSSEEKREEEEIGPWGKRERRGLGDAERRRCWPKAGLQNQSDSTQRPRKTGSHSAGWQQGLQKHQEPLKG